MGSWRGLSKGFKLGFQVRGRGAFGTTQGATISLQEVLLALASGKGKPSLLRQIAFFVTFQLELGVLAVLRGHPWGSRGLAARGNHLMKLIMDNERLDQELLRHLYACVELSRGHRNFTFAHDKANVGRPHLLNTVVVLDTNLAMLQCPQVETTKALAMQPSTRRAF